MEDIVKEWALRTEKALQNSLIRHKVVKTGALYGSLSTSVRKQTDLYQVEIKFATYGRYVDMVASRKAKFESPAQRGQALRGRNKGQKPNQAWYARTFYGRLHDLYSVLNYRLDESVLSALNTSI